MGLCSCHSKSRAKTSTTREDEPDGLPFIWKFFQNQRISKRSTEILISVWRYETQKQYKVHLKRWQSCCSTRKINPFTPLLGKALDFLTELLDEGKQYSAINTARSVLSTIVSLPMATWPDPIWETPNG